MNWSFQLYSARNFQPWEDVLKTLGKLGYKEVEGFGGVYNDPKAFRAELDKNGLAMPTGHFSIDALENDFDGVRRIARRARHHAADLPVPAGRTEADRHRRLARLRRASGQGRRNGEESRLRLCLAQP